MSRSYREFLYIEPPYTGVKRSPEFLDEYEAKGWWAQLKLNGTRSVTFVNPDRDVFGWNRHGEPHRAWRYDEQTSRLFRKGRSWAVYDGELMHNKTKHIKQVNFLYDILVHNNEHLTLTSYAERYKLLEKLFKKQREGIGYYVLDEHVWLAKNYTSGFRELFNQVTRLGENGLAYLPHVEGLVLKDPNGIYYTSDAREWMVKFRLK